jgi:endo-1,4-beta-xylanase
VTGQILLKDQPAYGEAVKGSPVIDGEIDELWQKANTFEVNNQQVGSDSAAATGRVLWDENNIYVLMEVRDSLLSDKSTNAYEQDCVEVFLDENNHKSSSYEADDIQARVNFNNFKTVTDTLSTDAFTSAAKKTENGYIVEIALPSTLEGFGADQLVGFDLQINDDADGDGKRDNVTIWNDLTGMGYADPSVFGLLRLAGDGTEPKVTTTAPDTDITTTTTAKPGPVGDFIYGDVDLNGEVGVTDVILLNKVLTGSANLSDTAVAAANVDLNTEVNGLDANYIMQFLINARTLPVKL